MHPAGFSLFKIFNWKVVLSSWRYFSHSWVKRKREADLRVWYRAVLWRRRDYSRFRLLKGIEKRSWCFVNALQRWHLMSLRMCLLFSSLPCRWPANGRKIVWRPLTPVPSASQSASIIAMVTVCHRGGSIGWSRLSVRLMSRLNPPVCLDLHLECCCGNACDDCLLWSWNTLDLRRNIGAQSQRWRYDDEGFVGKNAQIVGQWSR